MRLLEFQAKSLVSAHGIPVPAGSLWPALPEQLRHFVIKAQVPEGRRGKRGGIVSADGRAGVAAAVQRMLGTTIGQYVVEKVYVEERLEIRSELYLAALVDRDARCYAVMVSPDGGVDVEAGGGARVLQLRIDPFIGLRAFHIRRMCRFLQVSSSASALVGNTIEQLYTALRAEDAQLIEINPLAITTDDQVVAADVKMELDPNAAFRHSEWTHLEITEPGSEVERAVAAAGGTAVEVDPHGDIVAVVSGAGLMMATLDLLIAAGGRVRCMVDLGGTPLGDRRGLVPILNAVTRIRPQITLINAYFQTALADDFAEAIVAAHEALPLHGRTVVRLKGRNADRAQRILSPLGFVTVEDLGEAIQAALKPHATSAPGDPCPS